MVHREQHVVLTAFFFGWEVGGGTHNFYQIFTITGMDMNVTELQDVSGYCSTERERERKEHIIIIGYPWIIIPLDPPLDPNEPGPTNGTSMKIRLS